MSPIVPEDRRREFAEAVVRANYTLMLGRFDLDLRDGEMEFHNCMPVAGGEITTEQFGDLLYSSIVTADRYARAFYRLLYGDDLSPAEVIAEVEMAA